MTPVLMRNCCSCRRCCATPCNRPAEDPTPSGGSKEAPHPLDGQSPEDGVELFGGVGGVVVEPPGEQPYARAGDVLHGGLQLRLVAPWPGELGSEVLSDYVGDVVSHYASHHFGASFARQGLPDMLVALDVAEDDAEGLEELAGWSCRLLGCLPLGGQGRADVLEPGQEQIVLVAVVRIKGRPSDVGPVDDVLDRDAVIPPLLDE